VRPLYEALILTNVRSGFGFIVALAAGASLAGCAMSSGGLVPSSVQSVAVVRDALPPACPGQKTTKQYATISETFSSSGGTLCIPAFGGFGGSVNYPPATPSVGVALTSSTTNYNGQLPSLHSGTPIFYLQLAIAGATSFGQSSSAGGGLTSKSIKPGKVYSAYAQATISGIKFNFTPCYAKATKGKYGGVIGGVGSLLKGQTVPAAASGIIEIYAGKSASAKC
jgi:hypothetical protein